MEVRNGSQWRVPRTFEFESTSCCGPREHLQQEKQLFASSANFSFKYRKMVRQKQILQGIKAD